ncbi:hypothetical protein PIN31009_01903 [Pandoraea iniqua]|uniref:hypothetical protein n=1 Tax=Pandoraea iniqua TaxID=2508288 RepID=UPI001242BE68|nr:hypothetical protein [Pandoraea iniqua]VVD96518.1 hypothetical protein PIN31009_01903 [Pandoraea iniqua]
MSAFDDYLNAAPQQASGQSFDAYLSAGSPSLPVAKAPQSAPVGAPPSTNGFTTGVGDVIRGIVQSAVHGIGYAADKIAPDSQMAADFRSGIPQVDAQINQQEAQYNAARAAAGKDGIDWGRIAGNVVGSAPLVLNSPGAAASTLGKVGLGAGTAALSTAFTPVTDIPEGSSYADQKLNQLALAGAVGGAAPLVATGLGKVVSGVTDPVRQRLAQAGVQMTPGQILGGALQRTEDKLTSVPVLGDMIKNGQQRSVQSFNRAAYDSALAPIGQEIPANVGTGSAGVDYVRKQIGDVYKSLTPRATFIADQNFSNDLAGIRASLAQNAPSALNQFDNIVENQVTKKLNGNLLSGEQWGNSRSTISGIARNQRLGNATPDNRVLADALDDLNGAINAGVGRASPPDVLQSLQNANAAYSQYKQIERAAGMANASNNGNIFTASQYANALRRSATASQKATNTGLNGQFAADATEVLGAKYPDSGTVGRSLLTLGLGAAAGHAAAPGVVVPAAVGIGLGSIPYTATGQKLAQALLMNRPAAASSVANAISTLGPRVGVLLGNPVARLQNP